MRQEKSKLYRWELALLLGVGVALLMGTWTAGQQRALAGQLVRLHVVGASDLEEDQAVKLRVRDAVLAEAQPWLEGVCSREEAEAVLGQHLTELAQAGAEVSSGAKVTAAIENDVWFPTKEYTDFSLPAGRYTALRIFIGEGEGRNWWCVVFPPLCLGSVSEVTQEVGGFSSEQIELITGESEGYVVKFRLMELWGQLTEMFR